MRSVSSRISSRAALRRGGFTLVELLVVMAIIAVLVGMLVPAVQQVRETARRTTCQNNLHQLGTALHSFHGQYNKLPSGGRPPNAGTVRLGVFISLLPFIDQQPLWDRYDVTQSWGHANNLPVTSLAIETYQCPSSPKHGGILDHNPDSDAPGAFNANIVAVGDYAASLGVDPALETFAATLTPVPLIVGSSSTVSTSSRTTNGFLPKNAALRFSDVTDGVSNTIAIWESGGRPFVYRRGTQVSDSLATAHLNAGGWARPASDILFAGSNITGTTIPGAFVNRTNGYDVGAEAYATSGYPSVGTEGSSQPYSFHSGGLNVLLGDTAVKFLSETVDLGTVAALVTRNAAKNEKILSQTW
jgi:prepilin-type N-terminal cleavage/methylation domain-containing protein